MDEILKSWEANLNFELITCLLIYVHVHVCLCGFLYFSGPILFQCDLGRLYILCIVGVLMSSEYLPTTKGKKEFRFVYLVVFRIYGLIWLITWFGLYSMFPRGKLVAGFCSNFGEIWLTTSKTYQHLKEAERILFSLSGIQEDRNISIMYNLLLLINNCTCYSNFGGIWLITRCILQ